MPEERSSGRRMRQMAVSAVLLLLVVTVKLALPDVMEQYRQQLLSLLGEDTDFAAAFSSVGRIVAPEGTVGEALNDAYVAVFGSQNSVEDAATPEGRRPEAGAPEETASADDTAVYTAETTPANVCLTQQVLGFAYAAPVSGEITDGFGFREHPILQKQKFHYGVDIAAESGAVIRAFAAGTVTVVAESSDLGKYVEVLHEGGVTSLYAHCSAITASSGQQVALGDPIAEVGETGQTTGSHLHFELQRGSVYLNPVYYAAP